MPRVWMPAPRRAAPPLLWGLFCEEWLGLSRQQAARWWAALQAAAWSRPVALRDIIACRAALGPAQGSQRQFVTTHISPQVLIDALEDLIQERLLPPGVARQMEEAVLARTHRIGLWR
jgi:hypothetical protein